MDGLPRPPGAGGGSKQRTRRPWFRGEVGGGSHRMRLITIVTGSCVIVAGVSVALFSSPDGGQAGPVAGAGSTPAVASQPAAPVASSRATPKTVVRRGGTARSALRWPPGLKRQILRWDAGPGGKALAAVDEQMGTAMQTAGLKLYPAMRLACARLASDVSTAYAGPPIPDRAMQRLYARALARLSPAAADCHAAISMHAHGEDVGTRVNAPLLSRSRVEFAAASKLLYRATGEIESLRR